MHCFSQHTCMMLVPEHDAATSSRGLSYHMRPSSQPCSCQTGNSLWMNKWKADALSVSVLQVLKEKQAFAALKIQVSLVSLHSTASAVKYLHMVIGN